MISPGVFFIFSKFWFFEGEKMVQNDEMFCPWCLISQEPYLIWLSFVVNMCKMIISPGVFVFVYVFFLHIFKILIFWIVRGVKVQKNSPKWQKILSVTRSTSQEPYIIWFSFMVHICKPIISPGGFFIFSKKWSRMTKDYVCCTPYLRKHTSCVCHLWCKCVIW